MQELTKEKVFENSKISLVNTRQARFSKVNPQTEVIGKNLILHLDGQTLSLDITDEVILNIITKFRYAPSWLVSQWLQSNALGTQDVAETRIESYIRYGLLYRYPMAIATFLMPTNYLASLFGVELGRFRDPSYNILTHEISEEDIMYSVTNGKNELIGESKVFPYVSHFFKTQIGAQIIAEKDYGISNNSIKTRTKEINDDQATLIKEIKEGRAITTPDMREKHLVLYKKKPDQTYMMKVPDLAILAPREIIGGVAQPKSIAIEVELTEKKQQDYDQVLDIYWNNLIYGKVIYLITSPNIKNKLINSYNKLHKYKKPTCQFEIKEYEIPYNKQEL